MEATSPGQLNVSLRIRTALPSELSRGEGSVFSVEDGAKVLCVDRDGQTDGSFQFDNVFGPSYTQEKVYSLGIQQHVDRWLLGNDVTIMAFGQTCSGKSFSMGTGSKLAYSKSPSPSQGVVDRCIRQLFEHLATCPKDRQLQTRLQVLEVVNEQVLDLLSCATSRRAGVKGIQPRSSYIMPAKDGRSYCLEAEAVPVQKEVELRKLVQVG